MVIRNYILKALLLLLFVLVLINSGCASTKEIAPPKPVNPQVKPDLAGKWYYQWATQEDIPSNLASDMLFVFVFRGRDWREPEGVDGYALRVMMLDEKQKPVRADGWIKVFAVENSDNQNAKAFAAWTISPQQLQSYYQNERFPCYLLALDWGNGPAARKSMFTLVVRWESADLKSRYTRVIEFEDNLANEVRITKKALPSAVPADVIDPDAGDSKK